LLLTPPDPGSASITLAKLQNPVKQSFDAITDDLKEVYKGLGIMAKLWTRLDRLLKPSPSRLMFCTTQKFKDKPLPTTEYDALSSHPALINRAIAMHLLREGQFSVASTFLTEATAHPPRAEPTPGSPNPYDTLEQDLGIDSLRSETLRKQFANMYHMS
jgi:hypothetical protein